MSIEEKQLSEQESIALIAKMINKAKQGSHFHTNGTSAIMWGSVVGFCGILSFTQRYFDFSIGFDVWLIALFALVPQIYISIKDKKNKVVKTYEEKAMDAVWIVYGISIFALVAYFNVVPYSSTQLLKADNIELLRRNTVTGLIEAQKPIIWSSSSLMLIIYAFPTLVTGLAYNFKPMIIGALFCYIFFALSLYTTSTYDALLNGLAGIGNWLIPGIILRKKYLQVRRLADV